MYSVYLFPFQAYGIKFIISVDGLAQKFNLKNTVLNVGNGLALLGALVILVGVSAAASSAFAGDLGTVEC